ncbi:MAG: alkaline phosphatase family protein [Chthoniobacterales bacterium]
MRLLPLLCVTGILLSTAPLRAVPVYDHVVVVMLENHSYAEIATGLAPYINGTLRPQGANITGGFGIQHPSQPNYYWLFSGSNQGIVADTPPIAPFISAPNLQGALASAGRGFAGYLDAWTTGADLYTDTTNYAVRHVPWLGFSNVPVNVSIPFTSFPQTSAGFAALPAVSFVIPGLDHDMHNYNSTGSEVSDPANSAIAITNGDTWLQQNIDAYFQWAKTNNSLLIITTDEDSTADWITPPLPAENADAFTGPNLPPNPNGPSGPNQITMILAGAGIVAGNYPEGAGVTNVNILRTIESVYGLTQSGAQAPLATLAGIGNSGITDVFVPPQPRVTVNGSKTKRTGKRSFVLKGKSSDDWGLISKVELKVNGKRWITAHDTTSWSQSIKLDPGSNRVQVRAVDRDGTSSPKVTITLIRS